MGIKEELKGRDCRLAPRSLHLALLHSTLAYTSRLLPPAASRLIKELGAATLGAGGKQKQADNLEQVVTVIKVVVMGDGDDGDGCGTYWNGNGDSEGGDGDDKVVISKCSKLKGY
ncbi:hypothetical protein E2C01_102281 [Portunus trituberculatus]|uniref:Uncharacterized protein n=1 Tax=Portunus trituberculatus TaxID=210409 RepID=A0A5B7KI50_PORTR|nr:hypothetical protein [Portunus trituberculatus]